MLDDASTLAPADAAGRRAARPLVAAARAGAEHERATDAAWDVRTQGAMAFYERYRTDRSLVVARETLRLLHDIEAAAQAMYRYPQELRDTPERLAEVLVPMRHASGAAASGADAMAGMSRAPPIGVGQVPLGQIATIKQVAGPMVIRTVGAQPTAWVYVDVAGRHIGGYVGDARRMVSSTVLTLVVIPAIYALWREWEIGRAARRTAVDRHSIRELGYVEAHVDGAATVRAEEE